MWRDKLAVEVAAFAVAAVVVTGGIVEAKEEENVRVETEQGGEVGVKGPLGRGQGSWRKSSET